MRIELTDAQLTFVLQRVHELTQQNAGSDAGAAWAEFCSTLVWIARTSKAQVKNVIVLALEANDIPVEDILNDFPGTNG